MIEIGICKDCILFRNGYCFSENKPEKRTEIVTQCDYYRENNFKDNYRDAFIDGFVYCNKMKKQPVIERIENRVQICGWCTNWRCDDPIHLTGHCIINRRDIFRETLCKTCKEFKDVREDITNGKEETT